MNDSIQKFLDMHRYRYTRKGDTISVKVTNNLVLDLDTSGGRLVFNEERTRGWNPLSGFIGLSLAKSLQYNTVGIILVLVLLEALKFSAYEYDYTNLLIVGITLNLMWFFYILIKLESFKSRLERWVNPKIGIKGTYRLPFTNSCRTSFSSKYASIP